MLENLGIALRKQRRLIVIFFLTIFLPALSLGVFGVRAVRSERFRLARQEENEGRRVILFIRAHFQSRFDVIVAALDALARDPMFFGKGRSGNHKPIEERFAADPLIGQAVLLYRDEDPLFPLMLAPPDKMPGISPNPRDAALSGRIRKAESYEFVEKNFRAAAALYGELNGLASDRNLKADMLTGRARCLQKSGGYKEAIRVNAQVAGDYSDLSTLSGLPLGFSARLRTVECLERIGDVEGAVKWALSLYRELLGKPSALSENQFRTYVTLVGESIEGLLTADQTERFSGKYRKDYGELNRLRADRMKDWEAVRMLRKEIVPELTGRLSPSEAYSPGPCRFSRVVEGRDLLFLAVPIPDRTSAGIAGMFGVQIKSDLLLKSVLSEAVGKAQLNDGMEIALSDLAGRTLSGKRNAPAAPPLVTEYFEHNFPPWKIDLYQVRAKGPGALDIRRNFYFWTILTLIVVLAFGAFLLARTIGHEMEVLKVKSDFVSSVSHEFKTPLTSIKALMERLVDGKVLDAAKMSQYFSIIAQNTDRLSGLVDNLLDFSRIEEGKKEYIFSDTDLVRIVTDQVRAFQKEQAPTGPDIRLEISGEIPILRADADALSRALANLLSNAVKFTPSGKAICVGLGSDGTKIVLEVDDEGMGIPQDELGRIFEKFFQGKNARVQSVRGTGLGLTLVKHIVEAHGGRILAESQLNEGSKFSMIFPIRS
jgi:signal transduction histidine kinase